MTEATETGTPPPSPPAPVPEPPLWWRKWWPIALSVLGFLGGLGYLYISKLTRQSIGAPEAVLLATMMGFLPVTIAGQVVQWLRR